jgi:hypothetical protein
VIAAAAAVALAAQTVADLRWKRRVVVVTAPAVDDPALAAQRRVLARWRSGAAERDVTVVEIVGDGVAGVREPAIVLRRRYGFDARRFGMVLVGKDGRIALRSAEPVLAEQLQGTIDAMPMRRAGQR